MPLTQADSRPTDWPLILGNHYRAACRVVDRLMPRYLRRVYDPEDFVDDAIVELLAKPEGLQEKGPSLLTLVAKRRMIDAARSPRSRWVDSAIDAIDHRPSAALDLEADELRELMLDRARDPRERTIVELRCKGHTLAEIANLTGVGIRQLQRIWKHFAEANEPY
jgi:RNA polymerase sigma factor (sigma-70 family)